MIYGTPDTFTDINMRGSFNLEKYKNTGGNSGVHQFKVGIGDIIVEFKDGSQYLYNSLKPGAVHVQQMVKLARAGSGLNSFITTTVKFDYFRKIR